MPEETGCEQYITERDQCTSGGTCINWGILIGAIILGNLLQLIFEASLLYSLEVTYAPTPLEKLQNPEYYIENEADDNPDQNKELDCNKVLGKCFGEIAFIGSYIFVILGLVVGFTYSSQFGNPTKVIIEFFIAWAIDQAKSIPV